MRDEVLTRWVDQPPADPVYQYLRDAEKEQAWDLLGSRGRVLDVASEANVTAGLDAEAVARVDFSDTALDHAESLLGDRVGRYEQVAPETPRLPFPDDHFDAAVSIGPYDWRFLDVAALTAEVRRVVAPEGLFVFSVPTPRSPYETGGKYEQRYYTPTAIRRLLEPGWALADHRVVYQHPYWLHSKLAEFVPGPLQRPFVDFAERKTDALNDAHQQAAADDDAPDDGRPPEVWDDASYVVVGARPVDYEGSLDAALDCLFRPTAEEGFWAADDAGGHITRELTYDVGADGRPTNWTAEDDVVWRYAPFALMGAMQWRTSPRGTDRVDAKLRRQLAYFEERIEEGALDEMPSYGLGPLTCAFALAADVFDERFLERATELFEHSEERVQYEHSEDSLVLYGWTYLYERTRDPDVRTAIDRGMDAVVQRQNAWKTLFYFDNETTRRHQNQQYTLWGLARAIEVTGRTGYLENVEAVLDYTVDVRMQADGAFIWEDPSRRTYYGAELRRVLGTGFSRPPHWEFLYACHQTFFVNAVAHYYAAGGRRDYDAELGRAMRWIYGENVRGTDLIAESGLGVPIRFTTLDGRIDVPDQQFKGAYEVGSHLMALTNLLDLERRRVADDRHVPAPAAADSEVSDPDAYTGRSARPDGEHVEDGA
ncbi:class I SAM-dependent methyltransferase [Halomarina oriensis]|uniref:Methyltransferase domain-containing protein n=1 Tax=Halomarina oriensis TaxID=671145 RepID=A0A6B0GI97_9EURY|nr:methyltransferase domain-containing protein [Halomarina oriensis]MWG33159.1 methyltransferase domain-containing protein [Halomarina oriensis]